jgi:hypothetical protein
MHTPIVNALDDSMKELASFTGAIVVKEPGVRKYLNLKNMRNYSNGHPIHRRADVAVNDLINHRQELCDVTHRASLIPKSIKKLAQL